MTEDRIPTEQELDMLLSEEPQFDLQALKRRTLSRIGAPAERPAGKKMPLRGVFVAAVVCALSVSALAASYVSDGQLARALGIRKPQTEEYSAEPLPDPEPAPIIVEEPPTPAPAPIPEPEPEPEPPELDGKLAAALEVTPQQAETLRPAVQNVELTAEDKDVKMTVLQTVGDAHRLYMTVRFDFPETVEVADDLQFRRVDIKMDGTRSTGLSWDILERTDRSVTYLFDVTSYDDPLNDKAITLSFSDYGREIWLEEGHIQLQMSAERTTIITPEGNITGDATAEAVAALTSPIDHTETTEDGFTVDYLTDGTKVVYYDGAHGSRYLTVLTDSGAVLVGGDPTYDLALEGTWSQTWMPDYQDPTLYWEGEVQLFEDVPPIRKITLSPFLWQIFIGQWDEYLWERWPKEWEARLRQADGSVTDLAMGSSFPSKWDDGMALARQTFQDFVDVSDVTALIINGVEFPLS